MTEEKTVEELKAPGEELGSTEEELPTAPANPEATLRCGFVIGLRENGEYVWDILGADPGVVELAGLLKMAELKIKNIIDGTIGSVELEIKHEIEILKEAFMQLTKPAPRNKLPPKG